MSDDLVARALELADEYGAYDEDALLLRALVTRLQAAEEVCEVAWIYVNGPDDINGPFLAKCCGEWRAIRDGEKVT